jgi:hypothetical protein
MEENHRVAPRRRVLKAGIINFGGGSISCTVRNLSDTGAAIEVESPIGIPASFDLVIIEAEQLRRHCRVVWQFQRRIGVAFD